MTNAFHALLLVIAGATQKEQARQIKYLKVEQILRSKLPNVDGRDLPGDQVIANPLGVRGFVTRQPDRSGVFRFLPLDFPARCGEILGLGANRWKPDQPGDSQNVARQKLLPFFEEDQPGGDGRNSSGPGLASQASSALKGPEQASELSLLEEVLRDETLSQAWKQVRANQGAPGVEGMTVDEFPAWFREHKQQVRTAILSGE